MEQWGGEVGWRGGVERRAVWRGGVERREDEGSAEEREKKARNTKLR